MSHIGFYGNHICCLRKDVIDVIDGEADLSMRIHMSFSTIFPKKWPGLIHRYVDHSSYSIHLFSCNFLISSPLFMGESSLNLPVF